MRLSRKTDYSLRALVNLAERYDKGPLSIRWLAKNNNIPYRFLQQIMLDLRETSLVDTHIGRDGGVTLARPPQEITMGEIVRHFDGVLAAVGCVSTTHYEACSEEETCRFRRTLLDIRNYTASLMDRTTLAMLVTNRPLTKEEVFGEVFFDGSGI